MKGLPPHQVLTNEHLLAEPNKVGQIGPRESRTFRKLAIGYRAGQRNITVDSVLSKTRVDFGDGHKRTFVSSSILEMIGRINNGFQPWCRGNRTSPMAEVQDEPCWISAWNRRD